MAMDDQPRPDLARPAADVYAWIENGTSIHLKAATRFGDPVELSADEVIAVAHALLGLAIRLEHPES
jgi:hypothetical protein